MYIHLSQTEVKKRGGGEEEEGGWYGVSQSNGLMSHWNVGTCCINEWALSHSAVINVTVDVPLYV